MTTSVPPKAEERLLDEPSFPIVYVTDLLKAFVKAVRAHQLYLPNNPMHARSLEAVREAFGTLWQHTDELDLQVIETRLEWEGRVVLDEQERTSDNVAWLLYKDGIRELKMLKGFEQDELGILFNLMQRVRKATDDDDDLLTLMWEQEFVNLQYRYVDLTQETGPGIESMERAEQKEKILSPAQAEAGLESTKSSIASLDDFDSTLYFLDEREVEYLQSEIKREFSTDLRPAVIASLLDTFENQKDPTVREEICGLLDYFLLILLSTAQYRNAAYLLREAGSTATRAPEILATQKQRLTQLNELMSDPKPLGQLLQALEDSPLRAPQHELDQLFGILQARALETILSWIGRSSNPQLKVLLEVAAGRLAASNSAELIRLIGSDDEAVVLEAIRRAAALKSPAAVPALGKILTVGEPEMRLAAVTALTEIGSPGAMQMLERALVDEDREVRIVAVRALGARNARAALPRIEAAIKGKDLRESNLTEKMAFFEAYGLLAGDSGVPLLDGLLNAKGFMGKKDDSEIRACAAMALGKINTAKAADSLNRATGEKDVIVRNAVSR
ncbi:MAG TPA: HEAT repeat domain-containing protein, partial [Gemmatimonadaceae bacterium]|nr:HEAT repeat domain-containing protein [Gemmatimonadaceae bacterium]